MNLAEIRLAVRTQLDVDDVELPNALLDSYIREGFVRTVSVQPRWPFYEKQWDVSNVAEPTITMPTDANMPGVIGLMEVDAFPLTMIDHGVAEANFNASVISSNRPVYYSLWGNLIYLWPMPLDERQYRLRGYRSATDWVSVGDAGVPDMDERLHQLLVHYAIALAYAQQEDEVLEDVYMKRWQAHLRVVHDQIMTVPHQRPLIFNVGLAVPSVLNNFVWDLPVV